MALSIRLDGIMDPEGKYPNPLTGLPYNKQYFFHARRKKDNGEYTGWTEMKTWKSRVEIFKLIHKSNILLTILPPGTGKTVIIPKLLLHYFGYQKKIICTTPKQATTSLAGEYAAKLLDVPIYHVDDNGNPIPNNEVHDNKQTPYYDTHMRIVGYKHSGGKAYNFSNSTTLLLFTTDGTLKQTILTGDDPNLSKYGGVIIDEVHERSINIDIVLALLLDIIHRRPDFKVIIMSATINEKLFTDYFKRVNLGHAYSVFSIPGEKPLFKRTEIKLLKKIDPNTFTNDIYKYINNIMLNPSLPIGDILAFVTSDAETKKLKKRIDKNMNAYPINNKPLAIAFSANISNADKIIATKKNSLLEVPANEQAPQGYSRKIIIGTNAVESSITFEDDLKYVIESGLAYEKKYNAKTYCNETGKFYVSQASTIQRCGRTGRNCDGICYQLYTDEQFKALAQFTDPKILVEDITKDLLGIICLSINGNLQKALEFMERMIQPVKDYKTAIYRAYTNLLNMDLIDNSGNVLPLGRVCNSFNKFDIKIAKMCVGGYYLGCLPHMITLGAILQEAMSVDDIFNKPLNIEDNPELERKYNEHIKQFKNDKGDHLTLLTTYIKWSHESDQVEYANNNYLNITLLRKITASAADLSDEIHKLLNNINELKLFNVVQNTHMTGGQISQHNKSSGAQIINKKNINKNKNKHIINIQTKLSDTDKKTFLTEFSNISDKHTDKGNTQHDDTNFNIHDKYNKKINKTLHSTSGDVIRDNGHDFSNAHNVIEQLSNTTDGHKNITHKHRKKTYKITQINISEKNSKQNTEHTSVLPRRSRKHIVLIGSGNDKFIRNRKIMELITLKGLKPRSIIQPKLLYDKIIASLFYGYSNNIASYAGFDNIYHVKFSKQEAVIDSINDNNISFLIYNEFICNKILGKKDEYKLNIFSEIKLSHIAQFVNLNDIKKLL